LEKRSSWAIHAVRLFLLSAFLGALYISGRNLYFGWMIARQRTMPVFFWTVDVLLVVLLILLLVWFVSFARRQRGVGDPRRFVMWVLLVCGSLIVGEIATEYGWYKAGQVVLRDVKAKVLAAGYHLDLQPQMEILPEEQNSVAWIEKALRVPSMACIYSPDPGKEPSEKTFLRWKNEKEFWSEFQKETGRDGLKEEMKSAAEKSLRKHGDALSCLEKAYSVHRCDWKRDPNDLGKEENVFHPMSFHFQLARLLICRAVIRLDKGREKEAITDLLRASFLGESCVQNTSLAGCLIGSAIQRMVMQTIDGYFLPRVRGSVLALGILPALDMESARKSYLHAMEYEYFIFPHWIESKFYFAPSKNTEDKGDNQNAFSFPKNILRMGIFDLVYPFDFATQYADHLERMKVYDLEYSQLGPAWERVGTISHEPSLDTYRKALECDAEYRLAETAIRIKVFKERKGRWPRAFDEVEGLTKEKITDPFTDSFSFIMRLNGKGLILYSVGIDGIDNGGISKNTDKPQSEYDLVWKVE
jgi:hypothetical protein